MELIAPAYVDNPFTFKFREPLALPNPLVSIEKPVRVMTMEKVQVEILQKLSSM